MSDIKIKSKNLNVFYGEKQALFDVNLDLNEKEVTALIGPSGCGKSTFIRCLNRMNDVIDICKVTGNIEIDGIEINDKNLDVVSLRERVGMVFQKPNPFPKSIYDNISYGPKIHGKGESKSELDEIVENSLRKAALWEEVKDRLDEPGTGLSGGQQQRLCIARAISVNPEVILMDEPCSAEQGSSIRITSGLTEIALAIHNLCCCPPDKPVPGSSNLSLTSSHRAAFLKLFSTISSSSLLLSPFPCILGP